MTEMNQETSKQQNSGAAVAVLMSTYNGARFLRQQLDSILAQQGVQVLLTVRDDGSKDDTVSILEEYARAGKLTYTVGENLNFRQSFMTLAVNAPEADYYAFADQDDVWLPRKLADAIAEIADCGETPALCSTEFRMVDEALNPLPGQHSAYMYDIDGYHAASKVQRIKTGCALNDIGGFGCTQLWNNALEQILRRNPYPKLEMDHDTILGMLAILCGEYRPSHRANILYRQHGSNVSGSKSGWKGAVYKLKFHLARFAGKKGPTISQCNEAMLSCYGGEIPAQARALLEATVGPGKIRLLFSDYAALLPKGLQLRFRLKLLTNRY